jgi:Na+-transporting methylmalonyl-CoA/oxaloacetate decarboxylase gamma subunit
MNSVIASNFRESINILLSGMGGIFAVLIIIFILIKVLIKTFPEK